MQGLLKQNKFLLPLFLWTWGMRFIACCVNMHLPPLQPFHRSSNRCSQRKVWTLIGLPQISVHMPVHLLTHHQLLRDWSRMPIAIPGSLAQVRPNALKPPEAPDQGLPLQIWLTMWWWVPFWRSFRWHCINSHCFNKPTAFWNVHHRRWLGLMT